MWTDITPQVNQAAALIDPSRLASRPCFQLEASSLAIQIGMPSIDSRSTFNSEDCAHVLFSQGLPERTAVDDLQLLMGKLMQWLEGGSVGSTLYSCPQMHLSTSPEVQYFTGLCSLVHEVLHQGQSIKYDDSKPDVLAFEQIHLQKISLPKHRLSKFLRAFGTVLSEMALKQPVTRRKELTQAIDLLQKWFDQCRPDFTKALDCNQQCRPGFFKSLLYSTSAGRFEGVSFQSWSKGFEALLAQLRLVVQVCQQTCLTGVLNGLDQVADTHNRLGKAYLVSSIFQTQDMYCSNIHFRDVLCNEIGRFAKVSVPSAAVLLDYRTGLSANPAKLNDELQGWDSAVLALQRLVFQVLGNRKQWHRHLTKVNESIAYSVHFMVQNEALQGQVVYNWLCRTGIGLAVRQLLLGYQLQLYSPQQHLYIFYIGSVLLRNYERNARPLHQSMIARDQELGNAFFGKTLTSKLVEKVGLERVQLFIEHTFMVALKRYFESAFYLLAKLDLPRYPPEQESRCYSARTRLFRHCLFVKDLGFSDFQATLLDHSRVQVGQTLPFLREAGKHLRLIEQTDQKYVLAYIRKEAGMLSKQAVKLSLAGMTFEKDPSLRAVWALEDRHPSVTLKARC